MAANRRDDHDHGSNGTADAPTINRSSIERRGVILAWGDPAVSGRMVDDAGPPGFRRVFRRPARHDPRSGDGFTV